MVDAPRLAGSPDTDVLSLFQFGTRAYFSTPLCADFPYTCCADFPYT
jgi:hypothetical protein